MFSKLFKSLFAVKTVQVGEIYSLFPDDPFYLKRVKIVEVKNGHCRYIRRDKRGHYYGDESDDIKRFLRYHTKVNDLN